MQGNLAALAPDQLSVILQYLPDPLLIVGEVAFFHKGIPGVKSPALPAGFPELYGPDKAAVDATAGYKTKDEYLALFDQVRNATIAALDRLTDADLDKDSGLGEYAPTVGKVLLMTADHDMQHAGQFTVTRRKLGKPVLF